MKTTTIVISLLAISLFFICWIAVIQYQSIQIYKQDIQNLTEVNANNKQLTCGWINYAEAQENLLIAYNNLLRSYGYNTELIIKFDVLQEAVEECKYE